MDLFVWFGLYFAIAYGCSRFAGRWGRLKWVKIAFLPGVFLHAASRLLGCLFSMSPVDKIEFIENGRPFLQPGSTRLPYVGHLLSAIFTHAALFAAFFCAHAAIPVHDWEALGLPAACDLKTAPAILLSYGTAFGSGLPLVDPTFWLVCYAVVGLVVSFDVRLAELVAVLCLAAAGCWVSGMLTWLGAGFSFLSRGWFLSRYYIPAWWGIASTYIALTAIAATLLILVVAAGSLFRSRRGGRSAGTRPGGKRTSRQRQTLFARG